MTWGIAVDNLDVRWGDWLVLDRMSLSVRFGPGAGQLPIVGRSGIGKSTLLYVLAALKWQSGGTVCWTLPDGRRIAWSAEDAGRRAELAAWHALRRTTFGFAFQDAALLPYLTVLGNLMLPLDLRGVPRGAAERRARDQIAAILHPPETVETLLHRYPGQLSGGQRQRVALAQAMIAAPVVLFADEPTGNLDRTTRGEVMAVVADWLRAGAGDRAFVWVTHHADDPDLTGAGRRLHLGRDGPLLESIGAGAGSARPAAAHV